MRKKLLLILTVAIIISCVIFPVNTYAATPESSEVVQSGVVTASIVAKRYIETTKYYTTLGAIPQTVFHRQYIPAAGSYWSGWLTLISYTWIPWIDAYVCVYGGYIYGSL